MMKTQYFSSFPGFLALAMGVMIGFVTPSNGQESPISRSEGAPYQLDGTQVWSVPDPISGRDYSIFVSLPDSYNAKSDRRFPVLYVTDADYGFPLIRSIVRRINSDGPVTKDFIIVGLSYAVGDEPMEIRRRDYTPVTRDDGKGGGGPAYQAYLNEAVFPFVEKNLRADPKERIFMGHSLVHRSFYLSPRCSKAIFSGARHFGTERVPFSVWRNRSQIRVAKCQRTSSCMSASLKL
jgi:uncharacterized protein